jgi:hypothetical protein
MTMLSFDPKLFSKEFPRKVEELLLLVMRKGFSLTLIGGTVRDFLVTGKVGKDLDFELKHSMPYSNEEWISRLKFLKKEIQKQWNCEELAFNIIRVFIDDIEVEFSSARTEKYMGDGPFSHSDFEVELNPSLGTKKSVERRDFTLNSIGILFGAPGTEEEYLLVDPLNGINDLSLKTLKPAGREFYKDPVRLLRTLRFSIKYGYDYKNIDFKKFDLSLLTVHWFLAEAKKSRKTSFFKIFFDCISQHKVSLNEKIVTLEPLSSISDCDWSGRLEDLMILLIENFQSISKADFLNVGLTLNLPQQFVSSLFENVQTLKTVKNIDKDKLKSMSCEDFSTSQEFKLVKSLHQFELKYPEVLKQFSLKEIVDRLDEIFCIWPLGFEKNLNKPDYNSLAPELRSSYLYKRQLDV